MKKLSAVLVWALFLLFACSKIDVEENPLLFFWEEMDRKYPYFDEKGVDWNKTRTELLSFNPDDNRSLLSGFSMLIDKLKDGHVYVSDSDTLIRYEYSKDERDFFIIDLKNIYGAYNEYETDAIGIYQFPGEITYVVLKTFMIPLSESEKTLSSYNYENGLIIDLRYNGGGFFGNVLDYSSYFFSGSKILLYQRHKNGRGHNSFTDFRPLTVNGNGKIKEDTDVILLTCAVTYSAANIFTSMMKNLPAVKVAGTKTGGGGAYRTNHHVLPNGWQFSMSEAPSFDTSYKSLESGVEPDYYVPFDEDEFRKTGRHNKLDYALTLLKK